MKISKRQLRKIIREAVLLSESERYIYRTEEGELRLSDDDGNDEPAPQLERQYRHLAPGEGETTTGGGGGRGYSVQRPTRRW